MLFKTQAPKCNCCIIFLRNGLVGGIIREIDLSDFSQILAFDSVRKTSCILQKCKNLNENFVLSFFKQN